MLAEVIMFLEASLGGLLIYATSRHQRLFNAHSARWLPRSAIWLIVAIAQIISVFFLADKAGWAIAVIKVLVIHCVLWISLTLLASHWPFQPIRVLSSIFCGFIGLLLLGI